MCSINVKLSCMISHLNYIFKDSVTWFPLQVVIIPTFFITQNCHHYYMLKNNDRERGEGGRLYCFTISYAGYSADSPWYCPILTLYCPTTFHNSTLLLVAVRWKKWSWLLIDKSPWLGLDFNKDMFTSLHHVIWTLT